MMLSSVVLPQPLRPSSTTNSFSRRRARARRARAARPAASVAKRLPTPLDQDLGGRAAASQACARAEAASSAAFIVRTRRRAHVHPRAHAPRVERDEDRRRPRERAVGSGARAPSTRACPAAGTGRRSDPRHRDAGVSLGSRRSSTRALGVVGLEAAPARAELAKRHAQRHRLGDERQSSASRASSSSTTPSQSPAVIERQPHRSAIVVAARLRRACRRPRPATATMRAPSTRSAPSQCIRARCQLPGASRHASHAQAARRGRRRRSRSTMRDAAIIAEEVDALDAAPCLRLTRTSNGGRAPRHVTSSPIARIAGAKSSRMRSPVVA